MRTCQHCETNNDDTRVFCANCGTRLPAPAPSGPDGSTDPLPTGTVPSLPATGIAAPPLPEAPPRKSKKPAKPAPKSERSVIGFFISSLFWLAVVSAMLACLIQMAREPDSVPATMGINTAAARETFATLKELEVAPKDTSWTVNSKAINQFLETTIEMKPSNAGVQELSAKFQRAFVILHHGTFTLCIDQKFLGRNFYFLLDLEPVATESGLGAKPTGGAIGRMPIHPALTPVFLRLFEPTITGLSQPLELLKKAKAATITPDDATLQWAGTGTKS